jgi:RNA polymerase sigma factor (TIGR02999 family)
MKVVATSDLTTRLRAWADGDARAGDELIEYVYTELRRRAAGQLRRERHDHTLDPTGLVHELYLRLNDQRRATWNDRGHFFSVASQLMRRILLDHARRRLSAKRGGTWCKLQLQEGSISAAQPVDITALDTALQALARRDERQARIVELRYFGGLSIEETAEALDLSAATVKREWSMARAWLYRRLREDGP